MEHIIVLMMKFLKKLYEDNFWKHWQSYKSLFNVTIFRYLVTWFAIVPVLAKILSGLPDSVSVMLAPDRIYNFIFELPFTWEYLWIASFCYVIAYILYIIFCPPFVKKYTSYNDYRLEQHSPRWLVWLSLEVVKDKSQLPKFFARMSTKRYFLPEPTPRDITHLPSARVEINQTKLYFEFENNQYSFGMPILDHLQREDAPLTTIAEREVFWEVFGRFSSSKKAARYSIIVLLYLSVIFFSIVFAQHIWEGIEYFLK